MDNDETLEYFLVPAFDPQAFAMCCDRRVRIERLAKVAFTTQREFQSKFGFALPPPAPGQAARALDNKANAQLTPDKIAAIKDWVFKCPAGSSIKWEAEIQIDQCPLSPDGMGGQKSNWSRCGKRLCFRMGVTDRFGMNYFEVSR